MKQINLIVSAIFLALSFFLITSCNQKEKDNLIVHSVFDATDYFEVELANPNAKSAFVFLSKIDSGLVIEDTELILKINNQGIRSNLWVFTDYFFGVDTMEIPPFSNIRRKLSMGYQPNVDSMSFRIPYLIDGEKEIGHELFHTVLAKMSMVNKN